MWSPHRATPGAPSDKHLKTHVCTKSLRRVHSLQSHGLQAARLFCLWNFPGKNTGVGSHFLLQGIFLTQGLDLCVLHLLHWQADSLPLSHLGCPENTQQSQIKNIFTIIPGRPEKTPSRHPQRSVFWTIRPKERGNLLWGLCIN